MDRFFWQQNVIHTRLGVQDETMDMARYVQVGLILFLYA